MSKKITETVSRLCCHQGKDLRPYQGHGDADFFCTHCGQLFRKVALPSCHGEPAGFDTLKVLPGYCA